ncbi:hypothetical protein [Vibrio parahaemolyticus]|uniref:hypothetical protein n=1 Tax=Vibrio parahaemolyticus TaxID=670 RepID=UPI001F3E6801|nr:hypothetical protein [Vibrio parahaemolyticus]UJW92707.1 hypothetical protein JHS83_24720 [Vibrio parahaemolyticus]WCZ09728.1 hypothetical protein GSR97_26050 [Vibrio parahaemolyticus]
MYQLILADEGVFVMDPKNDEWAPHLMKYACEKAGKPFYLIDLNKKVPQLDLLADATPEQIEEIMVAGFSLAEKGDVADFYRIDDRKAAREAPMKATKKSVSHSKDCSVHSMFKVLKTPSKRSTANSKNSR